MSIRRTTSVLSLSLLLSACSGEPSLDELFAGRWEVTDHQESSDCVDYAPADPAWSALQIEFIDLEGYLAATLSRCEGGCDTANAAVTLDETSETRIGGTDVEAGLFPGKTSDVCQASVIDLVATLDDAGALTLDLRTFFGNVPPPVDGDCEAAVLELSDQLCDAALHLEGTR